MVSFPLDGNIITYSMCNSMEDMVENIMSTPPTELDGLFILVLLVLIIYMFSYIRRHK